MASAGAELAIRQRSAAVKVAVVCPYDLGRFGGVQDQTIRLVGWLREAGHTAWLVGPGSDDLRRGGLVGNDLPDGTMLIGEPTELSANGAITPVALSPAVRGRVADAVEGADVVHIHEPLMPLVSLAALLTDGPSKVGTFHADPAAAIRRTYRFGAPLLRRWLSRLDVASAVSPVAAGPVSHLVTPRIVPNAVDVRQYSQGPKQRGRVAFIGRNDPRKGLDVLLAAWPMVATAVPGSQLVVTADSDVEIAGVQFRGRVTEAEKRDILASASLFCAPNTQGESFGIVLVEAMAAACAVVASGLPSFTHVLADAGVLVAPGDSDGLADSLIRLLARPDRITELQEASAQRVSRFDGQAVLAAHLENYELAMRLGAGADRGPGSGPTPADL